MKSKRKGLVIGIIFVMLLAGMVMPVLSSPKRAMAQTSYGYQLVGKECGRCGRTVALSSQVGQRCPYCGAYWGRKRDVYIGGGYSPPQTPISEEIFGRVVNMAGQRIPGTCVRVDNVIMPTNGVGEFRFTMVDPGVYTVYYDAPGYVGQTQVVEVEAGQTTSCPACILSPFSTPQGAAAAGLGEIFGRVVNQAGQMIPGTCIRIDNTLMPTNAAGEYRFTLVNPGIYTVFCDAPGYVGQTLVADVRAGQTTTFPPTVMSPGLQTQQSSYFGEIRGQLVDSSRSPIAGAKIKIYDTYVYTDTDGYYRFTMVYPGRYMVYYLPEGYKWDVQVVQVGPGQALTAPTMVLNRG